MMWRGAAWLRVMRGGAGWGRVGWGALEEGNGKKVKWIMSDLIRNGQAIIDPPH
jgi:hypothetical protein